MRRVKYFTARIFNRRRTDKVLYPDHYAYSLVTKYGAKEGGLVSLLALKRYGLWKGDLKDFVPAPKIEELIGWIEKNYKKLIYFMPLASPKGLRFKGFYVDLKTLQYKTIPGEFFTKEDALERAILHVFRDETKETTEK